MNKILTVLYLGIFILFCFYSYLFIDPNFLYLKDLFTGFAYSNREVVSVIYVGFILVLFCCYVYILKNNGNLQISKFKNFIIIPVLGILAYPAALSFDIFNYIATAKVTFHYLENPYLVMPIEFVGDHMLLFTHAANKIALYGPLWILLTSIPYYLSFGNYLVSIILFKAFVGLFYFGMLFLISKLTKSAYAVIFFAASPLVLIETFISGHNDIVMMFFALASFYFLKNKKTWIALSLLLASILIKYSTIFLIPVFVYYFYLQHKNNKVNWGKIYLISFFLMLLVFFLSPIREEIYPWYAIWPLTFLTLVAEKHKTLSILSIIFSFSLMLRYIPFMLLGTYFGPAPLIKIVLTFIPSLLFLAPILLKKLPKYIQ